MQDWKIGLILLAVIGVVFAVLGATAAFGSTESAVGHFFKDSLQGTAIEQPAASLQASGESLTSWAHGAITTFTGLLIVLGLIYVRVNSKS